MHARVSRAKFSTGEFGVSVPSYAVAVAVQSAPAPSFCVLTVKERDCSPMHALVHVSQLLHEPAQSIGHSEWYTQSTSSTRPSVSGPSSVVPSSEQSSPPKSFSVVTV